MTKRFFLVALLLVTAFASHACTASQQQQNLYDGTFVQVAVMQRATTVMTFSIPLITSVKAGQIQVHSLAVTNYAEADVTTTVSTPTEYLGYDIYLVSFGFDMTLTTDPLADIVLSGMVVDVDGILYDDPFGEIRILASETTASSGVSILDQTTEIGFLGECDFTFRADTALTIISFATTLSTVDVSCMEYCQEYQEGQSQSVNLSTTIADATYYGFDILTTYRLEGTRTEAQLDLPSSFFSNPYDVADKIILNLSSDHL